MRDPFGAADCHLLRKADVVRLFAARSIKRMYRGSRVPRTTISTAALPLKRLHDMAEKESEVMPAFRCNMSPEARSSSHTKMDMKDVSLIPSNVPAARNSAKHTCPDHHPRPEYTCSSCTILNTCSMLSDLVAGGNIDTIEGAHILNQACERLQTLASKLNKSVPAAIDTTPADTYGAAKGSSEKVEGFRPHIRWAKIEERPLIWEPAEGGDSPPRPFTKGPRRELNLGTVEDDAATCQPHMY
jgi:hypothetical protein